MEVLVFLQDGVLMLEKARAPVVVVSLVCGDLKTITFVVSYWWVDFYDYRRFKNVEKFSLSLSIYPQSSNIIRILVGSKNVDHSDVVGASPVGDIFILDFPPGFSGFGQRQLQDEMGNI